MESTVEESNPARRWSFVLCSVLSLAVTGCADLEEAASVELHAGEGASRTQGGVGRPEMATPQVAVEIEPSAELLDPALEQLPPPIVTVAWTGDLEAPGESSQLSYEDGDLGVEVRNLTGSELHAEVWLLGDDGTASGTKRVRLSEFELAASDSQIVDVRVGTLGFELAQQRRSGQLDVAVQVWRADDSSSSQAVTNSLFYHPAVLEPPQILVYGKSTLDTVYSKGDYAGTGSMPHEEGVIYDRVLYGGRRRSSAPAIVEPADSPGEGADA